MFYESGQIRTRLALLFKLPSSFNLLFYNCFLQFEIKNSFKVDQEQKIFIFVLARFNESAI